MKFIPNPETPIQVTAELNLKYGESVDNEVIEKLIDKCHKADNLSEDVNEIIGYIEKNYYYDRIYTALEKICDYIDTNFKNGVNPHNVELRNLLAKVDIAYWDAHSSVKKALELIRKDFLK